MKKSVIFKFLFVFSLLLLFSGCYTVINPPENETEYAAEEKYDYDEDDDVIIDNYFYLDPMAYWGFYARPWRHYPFYFYYDHIFSPHYYWSWNPWYNAWWDPWYYNYSYLGYPYYYGGYGLAVVDKIDAQLFYFHLGEILEGKEIVGESVRRTKRGGGSQAP